MRTSFQCSKVTIVICWSYLKRSRYFWAFVEDSIDSLYSFAGCVMSQQAQLEASFESLPANIGYLAAAAKP